MLNSAQNNVMHSLEGGVYGLFGYLLTLILNIAQFEDLFQTIIMAVITTTVGVLTKFMWDKILKKKNKKQKK